MILGSGYGCYCRHQLIASEFSIPRRARFVRILNTPPFNLWPHSMLRASSLIVPDTPTKNTRPHKSITYIGLVNKTMQMLVDLFLRFKDSMNIYVDGTLEAVLSVSKPRILS